MEIRFKKITTPEEAEVFWKKLREYHHADLFPHMTQEEADYFASDEYYDAIMDLNRNSSGIGRPLEFVFFYDGDENYLGFTMYKIYTEEDGKAITLEFCIDKPFRNRGVGSLVSHELEKLLESEGATYFTLNSSNADNRRFWQRNGYLEHEPDEWGEMVYIKGK